MSSSRETEPLRKEELKGPISWMARNPVVSNLLAASLIIGGIFMGLQVKQEVFPEFDIDMVTVAVPYPGASPAEVEQGIVLVVEEAVRGLDGVDRVTATASEGAAMVIIELLSDVDKNKALADIKNAVDRITTFPEDAERATVSLVTSRREVINLVVFGDVGEDVLRNITSEVREELLSEPGITNVDMTAVRPLEIHVELPRQVLRTFGLTLNGVAQEVKRTAIELPAGGVKTSAGEVLLRTAERRNLGEEFKDIPLIATQNGTTVRLGDVATIRDGFSETDQSATYLGKPAAMINVYRVGDQTPIEVADTVKKYIKEKRDKLPPGVGIAKWMDWSRVYKERLDLLMRNAYLGLGLVFLILGLFLEIRLAFWVSLGIPISFLGSILLMPMADVSINMISMFAFIITLGMVVDDAIVVGENIYELSRRGMSKTQAAIRGARQMAAPVTFSILTTIAAFTPLLFVPGVMGKIFKVIPLIVIAVLFISLIESLFVLPAHLSHTKTPRRGRIRQLLHDGQQSFSRGLEWFIRRLYGPVLAAALRARYLTLALGIACLVITVGFIRGGRLNFTFMPKVDSDVVTAYAVLPYGSPVAETEAIRDRLIETARQTVDAHGGDDLLQGLFASVGSKLQGGGPVSMASRAAAGHQAYVSVFMVPTDQRSVSAVDFANEWRDRLGEIPGLETLEFKYTAGPSGGAAVAVELSHPDLETLESAAAELAQRVASFKGVKDLNDGFERGKPQLDMRVRPAARTLGVTAMDLGRQVRSAFFGSEALRQQRGRDEVRVYVRLPKEQRESEYDIEQLLVRTPRGGEVPLYEAADIDRGRAYTKIQRRDGRRMVEVTADVAEGAANPTKIRQTLESDVLPGLVAKYPGLAFSFEGEQREMKKSMTAIGKGYALALVAIFVLLAIPFKSYAQPLVVMSAIPFGLVGAVIGHVIMGFDLSLMSMMGVVALSGVVVNDSLILVDTANISIRGVNGAPKLHPNKAIYHAGVRRFRPILLTSLTTFFGLMPMIFETSIQARFLIPMAISLGYGILFATLIVLLLVPALFLIVEDIRWAFRWVKALYSSADPEPTDPEPRPPRPTSPTPPTTVDEEPGDPLPASS